MKKLLKIYSLILFFLIGCFAVKGQNVEDIIKSHLKNVNQNELSSKNTKVVKGTLYQSGVEVDLYIAQKRNYKMKQVLTFNGNKHTVVFNEDNGWEQNQFAGHTEPQKFTSEQNMTIKISSDIDSRITAFLKLQSKYNLGDTSNIDGKEYYVIKFDIPNYGEEHIWIDKTNYSIKKSKNIKSGVEKLYNNYKLINEISMPLETIIKLPTGEAKIVIKSVEYDVDLEESQFDVK